MCLKECVFTGTLELLNPNQTCKREYYKHTTFRIPYNKKAHVMFLLKVNMGINEEMGCAEIILTKGVAVCVRVRETERQRDVDERGMV